MTRSTFITFTARSSPVILTHWIRPVSILNLKTLLSTCGLPDIQSRSCLSRVCCVHAHHKTVHTKTPRNALAQSSVVKCCILSLWQLITMHQDTTKREARHHQQSRKSKEIVHLLTCMLKSMMNLWSHIRHYWLQHSQIYCSCTKSVRVH